MIVDTFKKMKTSMNQIIIDQEQRERYPYKDSSLNILSLVNQLYRSKTTLLKETEQSKIYFLENQVLDLI